MEAIAPDVPQCAQGFPMRTQSASRNSELTRESEDPDNPELSHI